MTTPTPDWQPWRPDALGPLDLDADDRAALRQFLASLEGQRVLEALKTSAAAYAQRACCGPSDQTLAMANRACGYMQAVQGLIDLSQPQASAVASGSDRPSPVASPATDDPEPSALRDKFRL